MSEAPYRIYIQCGEAGEGVWSEGKDEFHFSDAYIREADLAAPREPSVAEAARLLLGLWRESAFEESADPIANDSAQEKLLRSDDIDYLDAGTDVIEPWLRALAGETDQ